MSRDVSATHGLDADDDARLLAMVNLAAADGPSPAGTTSTTATSGVRWRRSARRTPTATRTRSPTRRGVQGLRGRPDLSTAPAPTGGHHLASPSGDD
jgi:hypothetical protein